ncbi:MAG: NDP-sugar synthase [Candidatus Poseidoniaceae archaeon]|jgi:NDP-sugar pyrophosphorylase family protein|nr:NDP-sugar synthase [Candidatus Poseidoniaceae archaeon]
MAGGRGTRLMPLTKDRPKPMVPVLSRPVIDYVKDAMVAAGLTEIVVTTGYQGEQLISHVDSWGIKSRVNQEEVPMGTAGSVKLLSDQLTETFVVGSGDSVASFDIQDLISSHKKSGAMVTMALWEVEDPTEFGIVGLSESINGEIKSNLREGYIRKFKEKPSEDEAFSNLINAGLYIIEPEVMDLVPENEKFDFSKQLFPMILSNDLPMYAKTVKGIWFDVGHPFELHKAQMTLISKRNDLPFPMPEGEILNDGSFISKYAAVSGHIERSIVLEGGSVTGAVVDSVVMANSSISGVAEKSIVGQNTIIESRILNCVIGDNQKLSIDLQNERRP